MNEEKLYSEVGEAWRHLTSWREKIVAGYLTVLGALGAGFASQASPGYRSAVLSAAILISVVFWILDFRNRRLVGGCQDVGARLEDRKGCYAELQRLRAEQTPLTHGTAINLLVSGVVGAATGGLCLYASHVLNPTALSGALAVVTFIIIFFSVDQLGRAQRKTEKGEQAARSAANS